MTRPQQISRSIGLVLTITLVLGGGFSAGVWWEHRQDDGRGARLDLSQVGSGFVVDANKRSRYVSMYAGNICLTEGGPAEILSVTAIGEPGGVEVSDFSVYANESRAVGAVQKRLRSVPGYEPGNRFVSEVCAARRPALAVELKPVGNVSIIKGLRIRYRVAGRTFSAERRDLHFGACSASACVP